MRFGADTPIIASITASGSTPIERHSAASDTITPAIAGTAIVGLSLPLYWALFHTLGMTGLALASDIGIFAQTASLALLLHRKRLVSLSHLEFAEMVRALIAALVAYAVTAAAAGHGLRLDGHEAALRHGRTLSRLQRVRKRTVPHLGAARSG